MIDATNSFQVIIPTIISWIRKLLGFLDNIKLLNTGDNGLDFSFLDFLLALLIFSIIITVFVRFFLQSNHGGSYLRPSSELKDRIQNRIASHGQDQK